MTTPRVLLLHTGGTLMMRGGEPSPLLPDVYTQDLVMELPLLRKIAELETRILCNLDSGDMQPHHWVDIARAVHEGLGTHDGVVVVHGTDTMAYTASALAFLLPGLDRPVVLTGAQRPLVEVRSDARSNLVDAVSLATMPVPEVGIAFGSRFFRGCRAVKLDAWGMHAFGTPTCAPLAELGVTVEVASHVLPPRAVEPFDPRLEPRVLALRVFPGLDPSLLRAALEGGVRGVVLEAYGAGNVPHLENSLVPVIAEATARDVPVVVVSQCARGAVVLGRYGGSAAAGEAGAVSAGEMTAEAAVTKLMVALGRAGDSGRVLAARSAFGASWAGECDP
ncbi:MAG: asparaginase [Deltaproteobacteria bacterium]|nr:asparaginase [Deltaproteobacteria bacterium]